MYISDLQAKLHDITYINMKDISDYIEKGRQLLEEGYTDYTDVKIERESLASVVYTSGTMGKSKGVMLTHGNIAIDTVATCRNVLIEGGTVLLLPLHHTFGLVAGGAPIDDKYIRGFRSLGITIVNSYGITECSPVVATNRNSAIKSGTVGFPVCCNSIKIADDGEIMVKGDNVMLGYYRNKAGNNNAFADGWFKTGDIGEIDGDGYLHITGRKKNLIIHGNGENISAEAIEEEIYTIPYVKECIVYGRNNVIVAEVYLDGDTADANSRIDADIQKVNTRLPQNRNIGKLLIRDSEFPKTTTKKIKRNYGELKND